MATSIACTWQPCAWVLVSSIGCVWHDSSTAEEPIGMPSRLSALISMNGCSASVLHHCSPSCSDAATFPAVFRSCCLLACSPGLLLCFSEPQHGCCQCSIACVCVNPAILLWFPYHVSGTVAAGAWESVCVFANVVGFELCARSQTIWPCKSAALCATA